MEVNEALPEYQRYTYEDYCEWGDEKRWELLDGIPRAMAAPSCAHQEVISGLLYQLYGYLRGKPCRVFAAPFDVRLNPDHGDDTVVQPDLLVVCDPSKLDSKSCVGAPDLVIEILSPSTAMLDKVLKYRKYLQAGVREYWIVDPGDRTVIVNILHDNGYISHPYGGADTIPVNVLDGCAIALSELFEEQ